VNWENGFSFPLQRPVCQRIRPITCQRHLMLLSSLMDCWFHSLPFINKSIHPNGSFCVVNFRVYCVPYLCQSGCVYCVYNVFFLRNPDVFITEREEGPENKKSSISVLLFLIMACLWFWLFHFIGCWVS